MKSSLINIQYLTKINHNPHRQGKLECPTCRVPMGEGQSLLALTVVKNALHECRLQGCNVSVPFDQIKDHEEKCDWRLVICPGSGQTSIKVESAWEPPQKCLGKRVFCTNHVVATKQRKLQQNGNETA